MRCSDPEHGNCAELRNEIFQIDEVNNAYITDIELHSDRKPYCIAATVLTDKENFHNVKDSIRECKVNDLTVDQLEPLD